jgi:predicted nuclease of predicted toxin-antitoxin system
MNFLLDENFPKAAAAVLERMGHAVHDLRGSGMEGSVDTAVVERSQHLGAVILTTDRDFFHTLHHLYPGHAGVIVIALRQPCRAAILNRLEWFLRNVPEGAWAGRAFQLRDKTWVAQPPIENAADVG